MLFRLLKRRITFGTESIVKIFKSHSPALPDSHLGNVKSGLHLVGISVGILLSGTDNKAPLPDIHCLSAMLKSADVTGLNLNKSDNAVL